MQGLDGNTYWARIIENGWGGVEHLVLGRVVRTHDGRSITQRARIVWDDVDEGRMYETADACLSSKEQGVTGLLMAAMGRKAVTGAEIDAVRAHLQDMRTLVFKEGR